MFEFSAGGILIVVLIAIIISIVMGTHWNVGMGFIALVLATLIGGLMLGMSPTEVYSAWPVSLMIQLVGITFFYGYVTEVGAMQVIAERLIYFARNKMVLIPVIFFAIGLCLGLLGAHPLVTIALLMPVCASIMFYTNLNPSYMIMFFITGQTAGVISPIGIIGVVIKGVLSEVMGAEYAESVMGHLYISNIITSIMAAIILFIFFRGWRLKVNEEHREILNRKPSPLNKKQKIALLLMAVAIVIVSLSSIVDLGILSDIMDLGWIFIMAGIICAILKLADFKKVVTERIPWNVIMLIGGFTLLLSMITTSGGAEMIASWISGTLPSFLIAPLFAILGGITSFFADTMVVISMYFPIIANFSSVTGVSLLSLFSSLAISALVSGCAPFSTGGAAVLSLAPEKYSKKLFWHLLLIACFYVVLTAICALCGLYG